MKPFQEFEWCGCGLWISSKPDEKAQHLNDGAHKTSVERQNKLAQATLVRCGCGLLVMSYGVPKHKSSELHERNI